MKKAILFVALYIYTIYRWFVSDKNYPIVGISGAEAFLFYDSKGDNPEVPHSVVAFVIPDGFTPDDYKKDLFGPFGYTSQIDRKGKHLYGRDTWGTVQPYQVNDPRNGELRNLVDEYPDNIILLVGVRRIFGRLVWPLNNPSNFQLELKG